MISKTWYQVKKASPKQLYIVLIQWWHSAAIKNYRNVERLWGWQSLDMDHLCRRWHNDWVDSYQFVYGIKLIELYVYTHTWVVVMGIAMDCINMNFGLERHSIINIIHYKWLKGAYYLPLSFAAPYKSLSFSKFKVKRTLSKCDTQHFFRHYCQGLTAPIVIYSWNHGETGKRERGLYKGRMFMDCMPLKTDCWREGSPIFLLSAECSLGCSTAGQRNRSINSHMPKRQVCGVTSF